MADRLGKAGTAASNPLSRALEARLPEVLPRVREALDDAEQSGVVSAEEARRFRARLAFAKRRSTGEEVS